MNRSYNELSTASIRDVTDLTDGEIKTLAAFVITNEQRKPNARYLEIGVLAGTTIRFCKVHTKTTQFVGVDLFEDFAPAGNNTHISGTFLRDDVQKHVGDRAIFIKGSSHDILPTLNDQFDFIFIDGNHTYEATLKDFNDAKRLLAPGGQIAFHNASAHMGPDFEQYVVRDGGPWLVTQHIIDGSVLNTSSGEKWSLIAEVDRLRVFANVGL